MYKETELKTIRILISADFFEKMKEYKLTKSISAICVNALENELNIAMGE